MLSQYVRWRAGGAVKWGAATAGVAGLAAGEYTQGRHSQVPWPSGHCLVGVTKVLWWSIREAEVAQDVGRAVAFWGPVGRAVMSSAVP